MNIIEKYDKHFKYASIVMSLLLAYQFLILWLRPQASDVSKIETMMLLIIFEFIMVHSGVFMAILPKKITILVLIPVYGLFAWGFSSSTNNNEIIIFYLIVVFNRMRFAFSDVSPNIRNKAILISIAAVASYFVLLFVSILNDGVFGELGLTKEFLNSTSYFDDIKSRDGFSENPHQAMSLGFFYYCALAIFETFILRAKTAGTIIESLFNKT